MYDLDVTQNGSFGFFIMPLLQPSRIFQNESIVYNKKHKYFPLQEVLLGLGFPQKRYEQLKF